MKNDRVSLESTLKVLILSTVDSCFYFLFFFLFFIFFFYFFIFIFFFFFVFLRENMLVSCLLDAKSYFSQIVIKYVFCYNFP